MKTVQVSITLDIELDNQASQDETKEIVYQYLTELIDDDSLDFEVSERE